MSTKPARIHYQATFAVLAVAVGAYALLQSLVIPVLPTIETGLHTSQNTVNLGADRLPVVGLDFHPHHGAAR